MTEAFCHGYFPVPGDTVIDVGAGIGREAFVFSHLVGPGGEVHCVEALPATFEVLDRTCELHGLENVRRHRLAISDQSGEVLIGGPEGSGTRVRAVTLAELVEDEGIETVDLIAMNVEGAELAALRGMEPVAGRVRHVAISCHDFADDETGHESMRTKDAVCELLEDCGFVVTGRTDGGPAWRRDFVYAANAALVYWNPPG